MKKVMTAAFALSALFAASGKVHAEVLAVTPAWAAHHKVRHPAPYARQVVRPLQLAPTKPAADPLYESCNYPWRHPELSCPGVNGDGG